MQKLRVSKQFDFEAAHALDGYSGKCVDIHGHSYHLRITAIGSPIEDKGDSAVGMVIDFGDIKAIVRTHVLPLFDHRLILRADSRFKGIEDKNERVRYVSYQPTCEKMLTEIVGILQPHFSGAVQLHSVLLRETANSCAEWFASDN